MNTLPYVRCVGIGTNIYQNQSKMAYDYRMICVLCGDGLMEIDGETFQTKSYDLFVIKPGIRYRVCSTENQKIAVVNFDTNCDFSYIKDTVLSVDAESFETNEIINTPPIEFLESTTYNILAGDAQLFEELYQIYLRSDLELSIKSFALGSKLLCVISNILTKDKKTSSLSSDIYNFIINNACNKISAESIARDFNYSKSYVEKTLRKNYGISVKQLIIDTRLKKAMWLLENTSLSCSEISSQLGFYSSQHFAQMFKKKYNQSPSDIR